MEKIDKYFEKCIIDAHKAEEREFRPNRVKWFYVVVGKQILFSVETPYARVTRRIINRINNNVWKNFGLYNNGKYFIDTLFQPNFVCNMFYANGKKVYLCDIENPENEKQGEVLPSFRYEQLCKVYYNVTTDEFRENFGNLRIPYSDMEWEEFREVHFKAFNKYPEVEIKYMSKTITQ